MLGKIVLALLRSKANKAGLLVFQFIHSSYFVTTQYRLLAVRLSLKIRLVLI